MQTQPVLSSIGFLRLPQIIGDTKTNPPIPPIIPVSRSTWWAGVKSGQFPAPVKLTQNTTAWRIEDIENLVKKLNSVENP